MDGESAFAHTVLGQVLTSLAREPEALALHAAMLCLVDEFEEAVGKLEASIALESASLLDETLR